MYDRKKFHSAQNVTDVSFFCSESNMTMMERVIVNGTVESCMAIYLGMAMEMP